MSFFTSGNLWESFKYFANIQIGWMVVVCYWRNVIEWQIFPPSRQ